MLSLPPLRPSLTVCPLQSTSFLEEATKRVASDRLLFSSIGRVYPAGNYKVSVEATKAIGWFQVSSVGGVQAVVHVDASRPSSSAAWAFSRVIVEVDRQALESRKAEKRATAAAGGYAVDPETAKAADDALAAAAEHAAKTLTAEDRSFSGADIAGPEDKDTLVLKLQ